jgi:UPF0716 protein FxsA
VGSLGRVPLLILLFILVPLVELYVIIQVGGAIGVVPTLLLLLADSIIGSVLLRSQGRAAWTRFNRALAENRAPAKEVFDGALIIVGGTLLLTPGFVTDIFGLLLLIPPTRAMVRAAARKTVMARVAMGPRAAMWGYGRVRDRRAARAGPRRPRPGPGAPPPPRGHDYPTGSPDFDEAIFPGRSRAARSGDVIDGTAHEVRDEDSVEEERVLEEEAGRRNGSPPHPDGPGSFGG